MEAKELRVGNNVYDGIGSVIKIEIDDLYDDIRKFYEPIELTEEILLKCGLEKTLSDYECAETYDFFNELLYLDMADQSIKINGKYCLGFIPEYLHQLQNLYFALTNEELEINI